MVLGQVLTTVTPEAASEDALAEPTPTREPAKRGPARRKALPPELPRIEVEVLPPEVQRGGLDAFERIGEETSEVVEHRSASLVVVRIVRPKFVRVQPAGAQDETAEPDAPMVFIAEPPERPIERGLAGPGLLAKTIVYRWQDHLPLYRQSSIHARDGLELARSTICGWHEQLADLAEVVVEAMLRDAFTQPYLCTDATGVLVQAEEQCRKAHFWVLVAPERHVLYRYSHRHDSEAVDRLLAGYKGHLVADAHSVYDHLNNVSEQNLRRQVLGRKNWLFLGSDEGARVNTIFVSLLASCQLHGIEPWAYLRDLFCLLPSWPKSRALELAPAFWQQTLQQQDAQQRLAANVFRAATIVPQASPM